MKTSSRSHHTDGRLFKMGLRTGEKPLHLESEPPTEEPRQVVAPPVAKSKPVARTKPPTPIVVVSTAPPLPTYEERLEQLHSIIGPRKSHHSAVDLVDWLLNTAPLRPEGKATGVNPDVLDARKREILTATNLGVELFRMGTLPIRLASSHALRMNEAKFDTRDKDSGIKPQPCTICYLNIAYGQLSPIERKINHGVRTHPKCKQDCRQAIKQSYPELPFVPPLSETRSIPVSA
jgi:hypothetical protein